MGLQFQPICLFKKGTARPASGDGRTAALPTGSLIGGRAGGAARTDAMAQTIPMPCKANSTSSCESHDGDSHYITICLVVALLEKKWWGPQFFFERMDLIWT